MKKKASLLTAAFVTLYSTCAFSAGFSDMPEEKTEYYSAFEYALNKNIIAGDGEYLMPLSPITNAQAVTILCRALNLTEKADISSVSDVSKDDWYYDYFACAVKAGLVSPKDGKLSPNAQLDGKSASVLLSKAYPNLISSSDETPSVTRADFVLKIYNASSKTEAVTEAATEAATEASTEASTEAATEATEEATQAPTEAASLSEYEKQAQEAKNIALGVLSDGSSYVTKVLVYKDRNSSSSGTSTSSGSRPSGGSSGGSHSGSSSSGGSGSSGGSSSSGDDEEQATSATTAPTEATEEATAAPTEPTEPPTYNGPISNDKDNTVDDPFDDGWTPGGNVDGEDEDFDIDDGDDEAESPSSNPTEDSSEEESTEENTEEESTEETTEEPSEDTASPIDENSGEDSENGKEPSVFSLLSLRLKERWFI